MNIEKKQILDTTFQTFVEVGLGGENIGILDDMVANDVVGFGTTIDEKIFGIKELRDLLIRQKEQSAGLEISWKINTLDIHISNDENTAIYTNEIILYITMDSNPIEMYMRFSIVLEYVQQKWMVVHWHGSKPEHVESEKDTWGLQTWKEKAEELEKEVAARTADLVEKNRELQVEAALERVRAKTMAMHSSEDVGKCVVKMFSELTALGVDEGTRFGIGILNHENENNQLWTARKNGDEVNMHIGNIDMASHPLLKSARQAWLEQVSFHKYVLEGEDLVKYYQMLNNAPDYKIQIPIEKLPKVEIQHCFIFEHGFFYAFTPREFQPELIHITKRFSALFEQTYRRYLDLVKAEAQAREAQIETALEKVRSRSMAMHGSEELGEVIQLVFDQLCQLNFTIDSAQFDFDYKKSNDVNIWIAVPGQEYSTKLHVPYIDNSVFNSTKNALKNGLESYSIQYTQEEKVEFFQHFFKQIKFVSEERKELLLNSAGFARSVVLMNSFWLGIQNYSGIPYSDHELLVLKRFANVFEQTYTRFLDLQKAEASAREATIETSLERLRSKTMAMHNSQEVGESVATLFDELVTLGVLGAQDRCGIGILLPNEMMEVWTAEKSTGKTELTIGHLSMQHHPLLTNVYQNWLDKKETYQYILKGTDKLKYYEAMRNQANYKIKKDYFSSHERIVHTDFFFNEGCLYVFSQNEFSSDSSKVFIRFAAVFGQTYRRYLDLQKAEAQALEAIKRASVDRVRAEIASMRTKQDLERITPLIWKELTTLGIPFVRCGVFIMAEQEELIHTFLSTPDGKAIASFHVPYGSTPLVGAIEFWRDKKIFLAHWGKKEYAEFADAFIDKNEIEKRNNYLSAVPREGIHLHLLPFLQGMLYVGNTASLTEDNLRLVQSVADAFSTAYARYEDFNKIESAKAQVEKTLTDLKQTQAQLVQSEKMASLGELTAGIAHEIQNPLNFVNNFSEVSTEMIKEIQDERRKAKDERDEELENDLLKDISENMVKINHHGKRAADIVKGMLQHSRSSSGKKEPTNINALADEYLRLAYHGLRAKDKSFNATMKTDFDESIGKIEIVPQDIGRVILNLITNAFYAVNERSKKGEAGYSPTVLVSSRQENGKLVVSVQDNGAGIPEHIKEKIFQPFFTTKPTGQGTGLGLSLSYDILKAHGGELKVESNEGVGTEFIILLPIV